MACRGWLMCTSPPWGYCDNILGTVLQRVSPGFTTNYSCLMNKQQEPPPILATSIPPTNVQFSFRFFYLSQAQNVFAICPYLLKHIAVRRETMPDSLQTPSTCLAFSTAFRNLNIISLLDLVTSKSFTSTLAKEKWYLHEGLHPG